MIIYQTELYKYPEFLKYLISLCQENVGFEEQVVTVELINDDANWKSGITGFNMRYVAYGPNKEYTHWRTIDTWNTKDQWNIINRGIKSILRDRQLESIGI